MNERDNSAQSPDKLKPQQDSILEKISINTDIGFAKKLPTLRPSEKGIYYSFQDQEISRQRIVQRILINVAPNKPICDPNELNQLSSHLYKGLAVPRSSSSRSYAYDTKKAGIKLGYIHLSIGIGTIETTTNTIMDSIEIFDPEITEIKEDSGFSVGKKAVETKTDYISLHKNVSIVIHPNIEVAEEFHERLLKLKEDKTQGNAVDLDNLVLSPEQFGIPSKNNAISRILANFGKH